MRDKIDITITPILGTSLATVISYTAWNSIGWAILHGLFGWFYVIYYVLRYVWGA